MYRLCSLLPILSVSPVGSRQHRRYIVPKSCIYSQSAPEERRNCPPETCRASLKESIKQILLLLVGCWYQYQVYNFWTTFLNISRLWLMIMNILFKSTLKRFLYHHSFYSMNEYYEYKLKRLIHWYIILTLLIVYDTDNCICSDVIIVNNYITIIL